MADSAVVSFLNRVAEDPALRTKAKSAYTTKGAEGLVQLGAENGYIFSARALDEVISPSQLDPTAAGVSIGWD
jgi:nitrogen fixation uncharacterized protein